MDSLIKFLRGIKPTQVGFNNSVPEGLKHESYFVLPDRDPENVKVIPGSKEGEKSLIVDVKVEDDGCSASEKRWSKVVEGSHEETPQTSEKLFYEGQEYDFLFTVNMAETGLSHMLPYNKNANPWFAAYSFLQKHHLDLILLDKLAKFIIEKTGGQTNMYANPFTDPVSDMSVRANIKQEYTDTEVSASQHQQSLIAANTQLHQHSAVGAIALLPKLETLVTTQQEYSSTGNAQQQMPSVANANPQTLIAKAHQLTFEEVLHNFCEIQDSEDRVAAPVDPDAQSTWHALDELLKKLDNEIEGIMLQWEVGPAETRAPSPDFEDVYTYPLITRNGSWRHLLGLHDLSEETGYDIAQMDREALQRLEDSELQQLSGNNQFPRGTESYVPKKPQASIRSISEAPAALSPFTSGWDSLAKKFCSKTSQRINPALAKTQHSSAAEHHQQAIREKESSISPAYLHRQRACRKRPHSPEPEETSKCMYRLREKRAQVKYTFDDDDEEKDKENDSWSDRSSEKSWTCDEDDEEEDEEDAVEMNEDDLSENEEEFQNCARRKRRPTKSRSSVKLRDAVREGSRAFPTKDSRVPPKTLSCSQSEKQSLEFPTKDSQLPPKTLSSSESEKQSFNTAVPSPNDAVTLKCIPGPLALPGPIRTSLSSPLLSKRALTYSDRAAVTPCSASSDNIANQHMANNHSVPSASTDVGQNSDAGSQSLAQTSRNNLVTVSRPVSQPATALVLSAPAPQLHQPANTTLLVPTGTNNSQMSLLMLTLPSSPHNLPGMGPSQNNNAISQPTALLISTTSPVLTFSLALQNENSAGANTSFQLVNTSAINNLGGNVQKVASSLSSSGPGCKNTLPTSQNISHLKTSRSSDQTVSSLTLSYSTLRNKGVNFSKSPLSYLSQLVSSVSDNNHFIPVLPRRKNRAKKKDQPVKFPSHLFQSSESRKEQVLPDNTPTETSNHAEQNARLDNPKETTPLTLSSPEDEKTLPVNTTSQQRNCPASSNDMIPLPVGSSDPLPHLTPLSNEEQNQTSNDTPDRPNHCTSHLTHPSPPPSPINNQRLTSIITAQLPNAPLSNNQVSEPQAVPLPRLASSVLSSEHPLPLNTAPQLLSAPQNAKELLSHPLTPPPDILATQIVTDIKDSPKASSPIVIPSFSSENKGNHPSSATPEPLDCLGNSALTSASQSAAPPPSALPSPKSSLPGNPTTPIQKHKLNVDYLDKQLGVKGLSQLSSSVSVALQRMPTNVLPPFLNKKRENSNENKAVLPASLSLTSSSLTEESPGRPSSPRHGKRTSSGYSIRVSQKKVNYTSVEDGDEDNACSKGSGSSCGVGSGSSGMESDESVSEEEVSSEAEEEEMSPTSDEECSMTSSSQSKTRKKAANKHRSKGEKQSRTYQCKHCPYTSNYYSNVKKHEHKHTGARPYLCPVCGKDFSDPSARKSHQIKHSGVREYKCTKCVKEFYAKHLLKIHMRTHDGIRPYSCTECEKSYTTLPSLREHMIKHLPSDKEKTFVCKECNKSFITTRALKMHKRSHTLYKCDKCEAVFFRKCILTFHKLSHRVVQTCEKCLEEFQGDHVCSVYKDD
ncbi:uncharacterized protein [Pleurodeles waltl]